MEQTNQHHGILQSLLLLMELQRDHSPVILTFPCTDILIGLCPCKGKKNQNKPIHENFLTEEVDLSELLMLYLF